MEEAELHTLTALGNLCRGLANGSYLSVIALQLLQNDVSTLHNALRHACYLCHMDTKGVFTATLFQFTQEDHLSISLFDADIVVLDALKVLLHLVELVIVGSKKRTGLRLRVLVQILHNGPGNRDTVIG